MNTHLNPHLPLDHPPSSSSISVSMSVPQLGGTPCESCLRVLASREIYCWVVVREKETGVGGWGIIGRKVFTLNWPTSTLEKGDGDRWYFPRTRTWISCSFPTDRVGYKDPNSDGKYRTLVKPTTISLKDWRVRPIKWLPSQQSGATSILFS